jgi:hypothetical protein
MAMMIMAIMMMIIVLMIIILWGGTRGDGVGLD